MSEFKKNIEIHFWNLQREDVFITEKGRTIAKLSYVDEPS
jgi:hypothetical protein